MVEQPMFGRRLRQLRTERGLTLAALAGDGMSTGYLSRLESGARQPSEQALAHLSERLGISTAQLVESTASSLAQSLTLATGLSLDETGELLAGALDASAGEDPLLRWQALWRVAEWRRQRREYAEERACLEELADIADRIGLLELRVRALAQLARCLRNAGEIPAAVDTATTAYRLAEDGGVHDYVTTTALLALVSALAEAGRLADASRHADEMTALVAGKSGKIWAEALWTAAVIRHLEGDLEAAAGLLDEVMQRFEGREDLLLWILLRINAARVSLERTPPATAAARQRIEEIQPCLPFAGTPAIEQELLALRAQLAMAEGRHTDARTLLERLDGVDLRISFQLRIEMDVMRNRILILDGKREDGLAGLRALAEQAQRSSNMTLAADIWRLIAETLAQ
jgi:transcriptional regulator with XRE-family HTH domain